MGMTEKSQRLAKGSKRMCVDGNEERRKMSGECANRKTCVQEEERTGLQTKREESPMNENKETITSQEGRTEKKRASSENT